MEKKKRRALRVIRKDWQLYSLLVLPLVYYIVFKYGPMFGNIIAFRRYLPGGSFVGEEWVGLYYFKSFLSDAQFWIKFRNTLLLSLYSLIWGFWPPIILALLLNELRNAKFKRVTQTISYLPHFLSMAIVAGLVKDFLVLEGPFNQLITMLGGTAKSFLQFPEYFRTIYISSGIWQGIGWGSILYLAAISGIDMELYEAARVDGANRLRQIWHITLTGIRPTIVILLILNIGGLMNVGFEKVLLLYSPLIYDTSDVISTYVYRMGLGQSMFSYATAIGLFEAVIGLVLVYSANIASRKLTETSIW